jgi:hypothetical protein
MQWRIVEVLGARHSELFDWTIATWIVGRSACTGPSRAAV